MKLTCMSVMMKPMRNEILEIAKLQMKLGGYENLNFSVIAKELNTTRANLHYHFKNKETLGLETTKSYADEHLEMIKELSAMTRGDFFEFVSELEKEFWRDAAEAGDAGVCVCSQLIRENDPPPSIKEYSKQHFFDIQEIIVKHICSAVESKQLKATTDVKVLGAQTGAFMMGLMTMAAVFPDVKTAKQSLGSVATSWIEGVKATNT